MKTYQAAAAYLGGKADRPLGTGRATRIHRTPEGAIAVRYHATDVITYHEDGRIVLDSGGWRTSTTKARINEYSPARVGSDKGAWVLVTAPLYWAGARYRFEDGITLDPDGRPIGPVLYEAPSTAQRTIDRAVREYIQGYAAHVAEARTLEAPGPGDCWGCYFQVEGAPAPRSNGWNAQIRPTMHGRVEPMGIDHYLDHLGLGEEGERYYVPSLVVNAILARGYTSPGVIWGMLAAEAQRGGGRMLADVLRSYFKRLKPQLVERLRQRGQA